MVWIDTEEVKGKMMDRGLLSREGSQDVSVSGCEQKSHHGINCAIVGVDVPTIGVVSQLLVRRLVARESEPESRVVDAEIRNRPWKLLLSLTNSRRGLGMTGAWSA